uniref:Large ribosomal subunit protein uL3c n=1 Tax=Rhodomonas salina TaxID=3034 RepID=RK3_RHOSW|nr:ribosomal protein L3 [Rhodomonas salina]A6MW01.1 RecName: Full=Large ribosomal subunit protein uL3c; AltName: Full=50S ribosomal protein L3, chloroplastic [Rhodomonas salina]ABO70764.1 50S ribosomal protein L3 [Rhodomonas salina]
MIPGILGTKLGMTQIFDESGLAIPVTVIKAGPCILTQIKTQESDSYQAIQIGFSEVKESSLNKPLLGHLKKSQAPALKHLKEYRVKSVEGLEVAQKITLDSFEVGKTVSVSGKTIGKGFAGTVRRYSFTRGPMTHGSKNHREPGSIGQGSTPGKVHKGKKMAGRLGGKQSTIKNLEIVHVNTDNNILVVKGAVPGKKGNILSIQQEEI